MAENDTSCLQDDSSWRKTTCHVCGVGRQALGRTGKIFCQLKPENDPASLYRAMPDRQVMLKALGIRLRREV
jgi:hypothetical protein